MTNHTEILSQAITTLRERGAQYGNVESTFDRTATLASILLNQEISPYEVSMVMVATKLARLQNARALDDNYIDAMNYLAMAAQFAPTQEPPKITSPSGMQMPIEADIAEIAKRFAPIMPTQSVNKEDAV
jgi:hypothetical protein